MWHEARKQEKKIRGMMVDYRKRSERRRLYYHQIRADPTQFLRLQGTPCHIYVEEDAAEIEIAASALMPWQGDKTNLIDRFDVRANLDIIVEPGNMTISSEAAETAVIDQKCQYERWRTLATNDLAVHGEDECLEQIAEDEKIVTPKRGSKSIKPAGSKIGFNYESVSNCPSDIEESDDETEPQDFLATDTDLDITFDVRELDEEHKARLNEIAAERYATPDFTRLHIEDRVEAETREYEIKEEQTRAERAAKLSKTERRKEKEERRKTKDIPPHMRVDDPHRKHQNKRLSSKRHEKSDSSSDEEKTVQNIEISSSRSNTYKNVKSGKQTAKIVLPTFLHPKVASTGLANLAATRKQLLATTEETFDFGSNECRESAASYNELETVKHRSKSRSRSSSGKGSISNDLSPYQKRGQSRSRSRSRDSSPSRSRSRSRRHRSSSSSDSKSRDYRDSNEPNKSGLKSPKRSDESSKKTDVKTYKFGQRPSGCSIKSDSLKAMKPHERLKLKLQSQLKKRQRDEKKKEEAVAEAKEQEAYERAEELRVLKRQLWEKEEEGYWKRREEEEKEYQRKKTEEKVSKHRESSSNGEKQKSRSRSGSRRRHRSGSYSKRSHEKRSPKQSKSSHSPLRAKAEGKVSLVPEYDGDELRGKTTGQNSKRSEKRSNSRAHDRNHSHNLPKRSVDSDSYRNENLNTRKHDEDGKLFNQNNYGDHETDKRYNNDGQHPRKRSDGRSRSQEARILHRKEESIRHMRLSDTRAPHNEDSMQDSRGNSSNNDHGKTRQAEGLVREKRENMKNNDQKRTRFDEEPMRSNKDNLRGSDQDRNWHNSDSMRDKMRYSDTKKQNLYGHRDYNDSETYHDYKNEYS